MDRTLCLGLYSLVLVATLLHPGYSLSDDDFNLVSNIKPNTPRSRGSKYFLGFMNNQNLPSIDTSSDIALFVTTEEVSSNFTVCTKFAGVEGFAETPAGSGLFCDSFVAQSGKFTVIEFPSGRINPTTNVVAPDIAVQNNVDRNKGVHVSASDPSHELTIYALNDELASTDGYMAISCTTYPTARDYQYVVFSAGFVVEGGFRLSRFLIVPCEDDTKISITGSQSIESPTDMEPSVAQTDPLSPTGGQKTVNYDRLLDQYETLMIDSRSDLTGTIIISDKPISVFTGHQCGQVPTGEETCDYLVEQIPPHATYGTVFFTAPFAARESGDIYRIASVRTGVKGTITCSQEGSTDSTTTTFDVNKGNLANTAEIRTKSGSKREFCCIQTDGPVSVMGYTLAHELDFITIEGRPAPYGDPAMVYIAPATSYLNDYTITTSKRLDRTMFFGYISYILPIRVFDNSKNDQDNFRVNDATKSPDSGYQPIYCRVDDKNEICAYGAYTEVGQGEFTIQYGTGKEAFGLYTYGFLSEQSYAYTGAFEMEPVGLAWIQGVDLVVLETAGTVTLPFRRFTGHVVLRSRAFARTRDVLQGQAKADSDYTAVDPGANSNLRWRANRPDPNIEFMVVILDDNVPEPVEYLEVVLTCDGNENCYIPQSVYRITIIDEQGQCMDLPPITGGGGIDYNFEELPMRPFGTTATYNCTMGTLVGPPTRMCDNGEWTGTPPSCQDTGVGLCPALPDFTNGEISYSMGGPAEFPDTTVATYSCNTGYVLEGEPDRVCNVPVGATTGEFGGVVPSCVPVCMGLEEIENGMISYAIDNVGPEYDIGTVATYICDPGFQLNTESGDEMRTCTDGGVGVGGVFSGNAPTCDPIQCPMLLLPGIDNGFITYFPDTVADFDQGTVATYTCNQGFNLQGERERVCQIDGTFSGTAPICTMIPVCMDLPVLVNGLITYDIEETPRPLGTDATYECNPGFVLVGQEIRTCVEDSGMGVFNGSEPVCDPILCQELAPLVNGEISYAPDTEQPFDLGTVASHECNLGFFLVGTENRTCVEDDPGSVVGIFSESPPTCEPIVCDLLPEIENGEISYSPTPGDGDTTVGVDNVATYSCNRGYRLIGTEMRTCEDVGAGITGEFSDSEPSCEQITCPDLPEITNGVITYNMPAPRPVDTTATYVCEEGFTLIGNSMRNCQVDETFSGEDPFCSMIPVCPDLQPLVNGMITYSNSDVPRPIGTVADHVCNDGYVLVGEQFRTCEDDDGVGQFDGAAPTCEPVCMGLEAIENGMISYAIDNVGPQYDLGTVATYSCDPGFQLNTDSGDLMRTCTDGGVGVGGVFSGDAPTCDPTLCPMLPGIDNGVITYSPDTVADFDQGTVATHTCNQGFNLQGESQRTCQTDGTFSGTAPICTMMPVCVDLPEFSNGLITYDIEEIPRPIGTVATYECNQGFVLGGQENRTCVEDSGVGVFNGVEPVCEPIRCQELAPLVNGMISYAPDTEQPFDLGTVASHECNPGFALVGTETRTCVEDDPGLVVGIFTEGPPTCEPIVCDLLPEIANGEISYSPPPGEEDLTVGVGIVATYSCNRGYRLIGTEMRTCEDVGAGITGEFSDTEPSCEQITCPDLSEITNGVITYNMPAPRPVDTTATYMCEEGFTLIGNSVRNCQEDETFSGEDPFCSMIPVCLDLQPLVNGMITYSNSDVPRPIGTEADHVCINGYVLVGDKIRTCEDDDGVGQFNGVAPTCEAVCNELPAITNGVITYGPDMTVDFDLGTVATYSCNEGYQLITETGDEMRMCVDGGDGNGGVFDGAEPRCEPVCDELATIDNGVISYGPDTTADFDLGTVATYSCNEGYQLISGPGGDTRTCVDGGDGNGGVFNGVSPTCEPVCDELSAIENGRIEYAPDSTGPEYDLNTVATYICNGGFELNTETGDQTRTCIDGGAGNGGVFNGQKPSCQPVLGNETICTINEPLMVSPFTLSSSYTFMGTCEHILLQSCPPETADVVVVADFITDSMENGAIGIFIISTGTYFISSEGGEFRDNAGDFIVIDGDMSGDHVRFYSEASVTVTLRPSEDYNEISIGSGVGVTVRHDYGDTAAFTVSVSSGSSISETCGLCGTQEGQLQFRDGTFADIIDRVEVEAFTMSYLVPARDQALRPQRKECGIIRNDTVIGDPLYTVPIHASIGAPETLCYEVRGRANQTFNLVSDLCVNVNAYYAPMDEAELGNIMSEIGVRAATENNQCYNIRVNRDQCQAFVQGPDSEEVLLEENMMTEGLSVRLYSDRVRISAPNCRQVTLVMWIICETRGGQDMLKFVISRGVNLRATSHGLLGQFWNIPVTVEKYEGELQPLPSNPEDFYQLSLGSDAAKREFLAEVFRRTWDKREIECLYAGNAQGGSSGIVVGADGPDDSVIEGTYKEYQVDGVFATAWKYAQFNEVEACLAPNPDGPQ